MSLTYSTFLALWFFLLYPCAQLPHLPCPRSLDGALSSLLFRVYLDYMLLALSIENNLAEALCGEVGQSEASLIG